MFEIKQRGSTVAREVLGGLTTFGAMSYIIFVQPSFLKKAGMDGGGTGNEPVSEPAMVPGRDPAYRR